MFRAGHSAFYDAIRSNNMDQLEALIESFNSKSTIWYDSLLNDYETLKLKNVYIHETMQIFVEETLARELFLRDIMNASDISKCKAKTNVDTAPPEVRIYHRLERIINEANEFGNIVSSPYIESPKAAIALLIARHIRAVKEDLKSTYSLLPWEEMEFYLSRYSFLPTVDKQKLISHLIKFIEKLKSVFGMEDESRNNESDVKNKIAEYLKKDAPIHRRKVDEFDAFYTDYELMKDEYSLTKILQYTELALEGNPEEQSGRLIVQRALQVIGEYVKNSLASPHLSQNAQEIFNRNMMSVVIEISPLLRNIMAHTDTLHAISLTNSFESEQDFFKKVQANLAGVIGFIVSVLRSIKTKRFKVWCDNIIRVNDIDVFEKLCEEFLEYLEQSELPEVDEPLIVALNKVSDSCANIRKIIAGNADKVTVTSVETLIATFESIIALDKQVIADEIKTFNSLRTSIKKEIHGQLTNSQLGKRGNNTTDNIMVLKRRKRFFKKIPYVAKDRRLNQRGSERRRNFVIMVLWTCRVEIDIGNLKILEYLSDIRTILRPVIRMYKSIEGFKEKFDITDIDPSVRYKNTKSQLDTDFKALERVLEKSEASRNFQSVLKRKREIHDIKLKIRCCYEDNKHKLTEEENCILDELLRAKKSKGKEFFVANCYKKILNKEGEIGKSGSINLEIHSCYEDNKHKLEPEEKRILDEELRARRSKGKEFLVADCYEEFLNNKREIGKFAGSLRLKSNEERFIAIFNDIKAKNDEYVPKSVLDQTIRQIEDELTKNQYKDLKDKFRTIEQEHEAKKKLTRFFDCHIDLEKEEYDELVASLNVKSKTKFEKLYKVTKNTSTVLESIDDNYGALVDVLKNEESTVVKICNSYVNFLQSLHLNPKSTELLEKSILNDKIFTILDNRFSNQLRLLKNILGNFETRESKCALISRYRSDKKLRASVEMILFDLCNSTMIADPLWVKFRSPNNTISIKFLEKGFFYLNGTVPFLTGNSPLRNYLAHGDALIDALPFDSSIAVISSAILFCEEAESLVALRTLVNDDKMAKNLHQISNIPDQKLTENLLSTLNCSIDTLRTFQKSNSWKYFQKRLENPVVEIDVCHCYELYLNQCLSQVSLFTAASQGDKKKLESLFESGEEIYSRESRMWSLLHVAANEGHKDIVQVLLNRSADFNAKCNQGETALQKASRFGHSEVIKLLVEDCKADINAENSADNNLRSKDCDRINSDKSLSKIQPCSLETINDNDDGEVLRTGKMSEIKEMLREATPDGKLNKIDEQLREAVSDGKLEIVKLLIEGGANLNLTVGEGSLLLLAAILGHNDVVEFIVTHDELRPEIKNGALDGAVMYGNFDTVKILVEIGKIDVNTRNQMGLTPLPMAVYYNRLSIVEYLMDQGAVFDENTTEYGIFLTAVLLNYLDLVKYLIRKMSDNIDEILERLDDKYGVNLLHTAISLGFTDIVNTLLETKRDKAFVNSYDKHRQTPLCYAASIGYTSIVETLLKYDADVNAKDNHHTSPLELSTMFGFEKIVKILLEKGADVNVRRATGKAPIIHAAAFDDVEILKILLEKGAFVETRDNKFRTALHHACIGGNKRSVEILLGKGAHPNCVDMLGQTPFSYAVSRGANEIVQLLRVSQCDRPKNH